MKLKIPISVHEPIIFIYDMPFIRLAAQLLAIWLIMSNTKVENSAIILVSIGVLLLMIPFRLKLGDVPFVAFKDMIHREKERLDVEITKDEALKQVFNK